MKLFIARHGQASFDAPSDNERPLTALGVSQTKVLVAKHLDDLKLVDTIWCSHLKRAIQTADVFSQALSLDPQRQTFLSPEGAPDMVLRKLAKLPEDSNVLIVSHQPLVGELVSLLTEGHLYQAHPYTTSEVLVLECDLPGAGLALIVGQYLPE